LLKPQKKLDYVHYKRFNRILAFHEKNNTIFILLLSFGAFAQNKEENATKLIVLHCNLIELLVKISLVLLLHFK
jgi:hypothetical protein